MFEKKAIQIIKCVNFNDGRGIHGWPYISHSIHEMNWKWSELCTYFVLLKLDESSKVSYYSYN
jgi:hypothetical protein